MKYEKPEVAVLAAATRVIEGGKGQSFNPDSAVPTFLTQAAYEADE